MKKSVRDILVSKSTVEDEDVSFSLALYFAADPDNKFYHYSAPIENAGLNLLCELYLANFCYVEVHGVEMYTPEPIHVLRFTQFRNDSKVYSSMIFYSNGAICIDKVQDKLTLHLWIDKDTVSIFGVKTPDQLGMSSPLSSAD